MVHVLYNHLARGFSRLWTARTECALSFLSTFRDVLLILTSNPAWWHALSSVTGKRRNKENSILTVTRVYVCDCLMKCLDCLIDWNDLPSAEDGQHRCLQTLNTVVTHTARLPVDLNVKCNACLPIHLHKHNYHQCACTNQWSPDI